MLDVVGSMKARKSRRGRCGRQSGMVFGRKVWEKSWKKIGCVGAGKGKVVPNIVNAEKLTSQRGKSTPFLVLPCSTDKVAKQCSEPCSYLGPALWTVLKLFLLEWLTKQYVRRKDTSFTVGTSTLGVPLNFCVF